MKLHSLMRLCCCCFYSHNAVPHVAQQNVSIVAHTRHRSQSLLSEIVLLVAMIYRSLVDSYTVFTVPETLSNLFAWFKCHLPYNIFQHSGSTGSANSAENASFGSQSSQASLMKGLGFPTVSATAKLTGAPKRGSATSLRPSVPEGTEVWLE